MNNDLERELGEQPIAKVMASHGLKPADLVRNSAEQITYKMVGRAIKGRRLTRNVQSKILNTVNKASKVQYSLKDLFNY
jgi:hypothetical protein